MLISNYGRMKTSIYYVVKYYTTIKSHIPRIHINAGMIEIKYWMKKENTMLTVMLVICI